MRALLSFKARDGSAVNDAADFLFEEVPYVLENHKGRWTFIQGESKLLGSGEPTISEVQLALYSLTPEMVEDLRPLFALLKHFMEKHTGKPLAVQIRIDDGKQAELIEF